MLFHPAKVQISYQILLVALSRDVEHVQVGLDEVEQNMTKIEEVIDGFNESLDEIEEEVGVMEKSFNDTIKDIRRDVEDVLETAHEIKNLLVALWKWLRTCFKSSPDNWCYFCINMHLSLRINSSTQQTY